MTTKRAAAALTLTLALLATPKAYPTDIPVMDGEGITVTAQKPLAEPGSVRISRNEIEQSTARDIATLISDTTGIAMTSHGAYGSVNSLSIQGLSTSRIQVRIDGITVSSPQSGDFDFTSIDKNAVESITIRHGGAAVVTVDITTRKAREDGLRWSTGFSNTSWLPPDTADSLIDTQRLDLSVAWSGKPVRFRLNAFGTRAQNRFPYENSGNTEIRTGNEMFDGGLSASADTELTRLLQLSISGSAYSAQKNVAGAINSASDGKQQDFRSLETVTLAAKEVFSPRVTAALSLSHSVTDLTWEDLSTESRHRLHSFEGNSTWNLYATDALDTRFRAAWKHDILDSTNTGNVIRDTVTADIGTKYRFPREITASLDCTILASPSLDTPHVMPAITLSKDFGTRNRAGIKAYHTFKMPDMNALYWSGDATAKGNPDLKNESAWGGELFFTRENENQYRIEHTLWGLWYHDAIVWQAQNGVWRPENVGEAVYAGFDNRLVLTPGNDYTVTVQYAWLFTRALTGDFTFSDGKRMPYQSEHRFSIRLERSVRQYSWHIAPRYESPRFTTIMNATELPGVFLLDAGITLQAGTRVSFHLDGRNLLNEQWMSMDGYPMPARSVTAGIRVRGK